MPKYSHFKFILSLYIGWRLLLFLVSFLGLSYLPGISRPEITSINPSPQLEYLQRWSNWDGAHFIDIARNGYEPFQVVFFPLYPILIKALSVFNLSYFWSGFLITQLATVTTLYYFYKLALLDLKKTSAEKTIYYFLIFPTSFFLVSLYSESVFLAFALSSFYYARTKNFLASFILAGLSSVTRVIGVFVIIAIFIEYLSSKKIKKNYSQLSKRKSARFFVYLVLADILFYYFGLGNQLFYYMFLFISLFGFITLLFFLALKFGRDVLFFILSLIPFSLFSYYLFLTQNHPLAFVLYETNWGRKLTLPWQVLFSDFSKLYQLGFFKISLTHQTFIELLFAVIFIIGFLVSIKKLRASYTFYYGASLILPLLTGTLLSIPRFVLVLFPFFILIAGIENKLFQQFWIIFSVLLLALFTILFINNYWIS